MSAYKKIQCTLKDRATLLKALASLGLQAEEHAEPVMLHGFAGDERQEQAEIVIPRSDLDQNFTCLSNDLGFSWNTAAEQFDMICSDYDEMMKIPQRVRQAYALVAIETA